MNIPLKPKAGLNVPPATYGIDLSSEETAARLHSAAERQLRLPDPFVSRRRRHYFGKGIFRQSRATEFREQRRGRGKASTKSRRDSAIPDCSGTVQVASLSIPELPQANR